jgi:hypothetical protein
MDSNWTENQNQNPFFLKRTKKKVLLALPAKAKIIVFGFIIEYIVA